MLLPKKSIAIIVGLLLLGGGESSEPTRAYHLGFTPFPYDISQAAIDYVYATIGNDAGLLEQADQRNFIFVINFVLRDYDALWEAIGSPQWAIVWRDTGLYDENGVSRPALDTWRDALDRDHVDARGNSEVATFGN